MRPFPEFQGGEPVSKPSSVREQEEASSAQHTKQEQLGAPYNAKYIVVDSISGLIGRTSNPELASTPKQVHNFMLKHLPNLNADQVNLLQTIQIENRNITSLEGSKLPEWIKTILIKHEEIADTVSSFIWNAGRTDKSYMAEIKSKISEIQKNVGDLQNIVDQKISKNNLDVKENDFANKVNSFFSSKLSDDLQYLLAQLADFQEDLSTLLKEKNPSGTQELRTNIKECQAEINKIRSDLGKNLRKEIKNLRKEIIAEARSILENSLENELKPLQNDTPELEAAKKIVSFNNSALSILHKIKSLPFVEISEESKIRVSYNEGTNEEFTAPTNFSDRFQIGSKGYYERGPEEMTVRKHVQTHFEGRAPDFSKMGLGTTFEKLQDNDNVNYEQLHFAIANKLLDLHMFNDETSFIAAELDELVENSFEGDKKFKSLDELKEALKVRYKLNNQKSEKIDRQTFFDLVSKGSGRPLDLMQAPEYHALLKEALEDGSWQDDEEKMITFTHLREDQFKEVDSKIDGLFADEAAQAVLQKFLEPQK